MKLKSTHRHLLATLCVLSISAGFANAAVTITSSATAPTIDGADIAMLNVTGRTFSAGIDSVFSGGTTRPAQGQSFTTGSNAGGYLMSAATLFADANMASNYDALLRIGTISGTTFTSIGSYTPTNTAPNTNDRYLTITIDTPILLAANTVYGFDFGKALGTANQGFTNAVVEDTWKIDTQEAPHTPQGLVALAPRQSPCVALRQTVFSMWIW